MDRRLVWFALLLAPVLGWSAIKPHDFFTWLLEVIPVLIGLPVAFAVQRRFPLSGLLLGLLWLHSVILIVGGHYTYARVPLGDWAMEWFGWPRNNYDKLGHFAQGLCRRSWCGRYCCGPRRWAWGGDRPPDGLNCRRHPCHPNPLNLPGGRAPPRGQASGSVSWS